MGSGKKDPEKVKVTDIIWTTTPTYYWLVYMNMGASIVESLSFFTYTCAVMNYEFVDKIAIQSSGN